VLLIELLISDNIEVDYYMSELSLYIIISTRNIYNHTEKIYDDCVIFYKFKSTFSIPQNIVGVIYKLYVESINYKNIETNAYLPLYLNDIIKPLIENLERFKKIDESTLEEAEEFEDNSYQKFLLLNIENILKMSRDYSFLFNPDEIWFANIYLNELNSMQKEAISKLLTRSSLWINKSKLGIADELLDELCKTTLIQKCSHDISEEELYIYLYYLNNEELKHLQSELYKLTKTTKNEKYISIDFFQNNSFFRLSNYLDFPVFKSHCAYISSEITKFNREKGSKPTENKYMNTATNYRKVKISKNTFTNKLAQIGTIIKMIESFLHDKSSLIMHSFLCKSDTDDRKMKIHKLLSSFGLYSLSPGFAKIFDTASRLFFFYSEDINSISKEFYGLENFEKYENYISNKNGGDHLIPIFTDRNSFKLYDNLHQIKNAVLINSMIFNNNGLNFNLVKEFYLYMLFLLNEKLFKHIFAIEDVNIQNFDTVIDKEDIFKQINELKFNDILVEMLLDTKFHYVKDTFLCKYEYSHIAAELLTYFCEAAEKLKQYNFAAFCYMFLLLSPYLNKKRGLWWYRLVLIYNKYIKAKVVCIKLLNKTVSDKYIKSGFLVKIKQYFKMFEKQKTSKSKKSTEEKEVLNNLKTLEIETQCEVDEKRFKKVVIEADSIYNQYTGRRVYSVKGEQTTVEILAINYYKDFGYTGVHGENLILPALYNIFLWEIIYYDKVPYAFQSPFQTFPLDLFTYDFYTSRKDLINNRLQEISEYTIPQMKLYIDTIYLSKKNTKTVFIIWNHMYNEKDLITKIATAITPAKLAKLFIEFAKNLKFMLKGMPDLFLWKENKGKVVEGSALLVEVKSTNDKLSEHQKYWLDLLDRLNITIELLHIT
jgi:hypothetical protein